MVQPLCYPCTNRCRVLVRILDIQSIECILSGSKFESVLPFGSDASFAFVWHFQWFGRLNSRLRIQLLWTNRESVDGFEEKSLLGSTRVTSSASSQGDLELAAFFLLTFTSTSPSSQLKPSRWHQLQLNQREQKGTNATLIACHLNLIPLTLLPPLSPLPSTCFSGPHVDETLTKKRKVDVMSQSKGKGKDGAPSFSDTLRRLNEESKAAGGELI